MPKTRTNPPVPSRQKGQRSLDEPLYLVRPFFNWTQPTWVTSEAWRKTVQSQQICMLCREALIGNLLSLDWKIEARDSTKRDELKDQIDYYTKFFEYTGDYDYSELIEWLGADLLDLPFGSAAELGRESDNPDGKVLWIELLDGGTLYPTLNKDWPIGQYVPEAATTPVFFPTHAINRMYFSPRTEIKRKGWGMAPPEKIWIALNLISTGDNYYAKLLSDTPDAGILDLIDMDKESAASWVEGWRQLLTGVDPQKIPVLYEHTQAAEWIPFTRNPSDIQYSEAIGRYTTILTAGYGMTPSDIGMGGSQNGGNTMAGNLRDERKSKRNGYARFKRKFTEFFNRILPPDLRFKFIDMDDELMVAVGRARLASATAMTAMVNGNLFTENEMRQQAVADGYITVSVPEELPPELQKKIDQKQQMAEQFQLGKINAFGNQNGKNPKDNKQKGGKPGAERPSMLGRPVSPSSGGWGETAARSALQEWSAFLLEADDKYFQRLAYLAYPSITADAVGIWTALEDQSQISEWLGKHEEALWTGEGGDDLPELSRTVLNIVKPNLLADLLKDPWWRFEDERHLAEIMAEESQALMDAERENLKTRAYIENFSLPEIVVDVMPVRERLIQNALGLFAYAPELIANSVVSGVRDYILEHPNRDMLDAVYSADLIQSIRSKLDQGLVGLSEAFMQNTSGIIIEEIVKGASKDA